LNVRFAPDGKRLFTASPDVDYGVGEITSYKGQIQVWDVTRWKQIGKLDKGRSGINRLAVSPDGRLLVIGEGNGELTVLDAQTLQETKVLCPGDPKRGGMVSSPEGLFFVGDSSRLALNDGFEIVFRRMRTGPVTASWGL